MTPERSANIDRVLSHRQPDLAVLVLSDYVEQAFATELLTGMWSSRASSE